MNNLDPAVFFYFLIVYASNPCRPRPGLIFIEIVLINREPLRLKYSQHMIIWLWVYLVNRAWVFTIAVELICLTLTTDLMLSISPTHLRR